MVVGAQGGAGPGTEDGREAAWDGELQCLGGGPLAAPREPARVVGHSLRSLPVQTPRWGGACLNFLSQRLLDTEDGDFAGCLVAKATL